MIMMMIIIIIITSIIVMITNPIVVIIIIITISNTPLPQNLAIIITIRLRIVKAWFNGTNLKNSLFES